MDGKGTTNVVEMRRSSKVVENPNEDQRVMMEAMEGVKKLAERESDDGGEGLILTHDNFQELGEQRKEVSGSLNGLEKQKRGSWREGLEGQNFLVSPLHLLHLLQL